MAQKSPRRDVFNLKAFEDSWEAVNFIATARKLSQPEVIEQYALPALRKELAKIMKEQSAKAGA